MYLKPPYTASVRPSASRQSLMISGTSFPSHRMRLGNLFLSAHEDLPITELSASLRAVHPASRDSSLSPRIRWRCAFPPLHRFSPDGQCLPLAPNTDARVSALSATSNSSKTSRLFKFETSVLPSVVNIPASANPPRESVRDAPHPENSLSGLSSVYPSSVSAVHGSAKVPFPDGSVPRPYGFNM